MVLAMRPLTFLGVGMAFYYLLPVIGIVGDDLATLHIGLKTGQRLAQAYQNPQLHIFAAVALALLALWALKSGRRDLSPGGGGGAPSPSHLPVLVDSPPGQVHRPQARPPPPGGEE